MRACVFFLGLLASAVIVSVRGKPHGKHQTHSKLSQSPQEKETGSLEPNEDKGLVLPTVFPVEASSQGEEGEILNYENDGEDSDRGEATALEEMEGGEKISPVLLSEEALTQLLQGSEEAQELGEDEEQEDVKKQGEEEPVEVKESDLVEAGGDEKTKEVVGGEAVEGDYLDSSSESEIPFNLDYAADSDASEPLVTKLEEAGVKTENINLSTKKDGKKKEEKKDEGVLPTAMADYDPQETKEDPEEHQEQADMPVEESQGKESKPSEADENEKNDSTKSKDDGEANQQETNNSVEVEATHVSDAEVEEKDKDKNESSGQRKGKTRKQRKNQRVRNVQGDEGSVEEVPEEHGPKKDQEKEPDSTDNTIQKSKKRKLGKWGPLVGMNPVQIRATVELYPSLWPPHRSNGQEASDDPCENYRCKRGKICKVDKDGKPGCVCQDPSECPPSVKEFEHVCGTDNKTYDTSCQLFATKCGFEGTKKGHKLHLDYTGSCKFIAPCLDTELAQFPLRMRDWLKNVLLQLYEHDSMAPGFLTPKQRARVQKIYENERRLHAGEHPIDLLVQDFEKNYNMYIYPVHWQFAQIDQHPSDRLLSHSELAPLRVPLVPMEHCTSRFFQECDADKDKLVSFKEWCRCFGIKEEDMDTKLLF
ncbi:SPARC-like protein 1 [Chanos chanos]|uniref:SPARC-like protein 1 n=1 Tax=Chanos chanos TaxID=29144 RepID=A0A6J2WIL2_CHACN|nr:SPARC-like protein 1 [Chanos chanos]